ncbi:winged helix DNA-binding protein [Gordonia amarae]|uniref:MarR family winged helix-turn-helix transcriptional regulator n=1 Tax=Gordonia amarae TaxID=36821 RepID=UPI001AF39A32|nr:MarR family winged helix-turn-helix transcriptional regulator [Gordonia amarae]QHN32823.1 winged helix DNA-binding protein [Gordonia amarae]
MANDGDVAGSPPDEEYSPDGPGCTQSHRDTAQQDEVDRADENAPGAEPPLDREQAIASIIQSIFFLARKIQRINLGDRAMYLSNVESLILRHIDVNPGIVPGKISADLDLRSGNTSTALRSLEAKGLITKDVGETDRRRSHFRLTEAAHAEVAEVRSIWAETLGPLIGPDADLDAVLLVLGRLDVGLTD